MNPPDCNRRGKLIGGCKFQPRYEVVPADLHGININSPDPASILRALSSTIYVGEACTRCGRQVYGSAEYKESQQLAAYEDQTVKLINKIRRSHD